MADHRPAKNISLAITLTLAATLLAAPLLAVQPAQWLHTTEADFAEGTPENAVITNLGDIKLAKAADTIGQIPEDASIIYDLQQTPDGKIFLAAGPKAILLQKSGDDINQLLTVDASQIFALDTFNDKLLVAVSSQKSSLAILSDDNKLTTLVTLDNVRYIWDTLVVGQTIYIATGIEGQILAINFAIKDENGKPDIKTILDTSQTNILCLASDASGRIYAGTDTDGLIYRITTKPDDEPQIFVLYDAAEPEIGALLVQPDGTVFAGTADAEQARPGRLEEAAQAEVGRPDDPAKPVKPADIPNTPPSPQPLSTPADTTPTPNAKKPDKTTPDTPAQPEKPATENEQITPADQSPSKPTAQQHDQLRNIIQKRLEKARKTGQLQAGRPSVSKSKASSSRPSRRPSSAAQPDQEGNAIYRINTNGFVSEVFRESVMILNIAIDSNGKLLVATGNEGQIFRVDPIAEETIILADLESQQIPAILNTADELLIATANPATLTKLDTGFADSGTYTSIVLDASQISLWGTLNIFATTPKDTFITIETRSGNVQDPEMAAWSPWQTSSILASDDEITPLAPRTAKIASPPARFLQYRLVLNSNNSSTPIVARVQLAYIVPNLKPQVTSITALYGNEQQGPKQPQPASNDEQPQPLQALAIEWEAADANADPLLHTLEYQPAGTNTWLPLAEDLAELTYEWQTQRVPDGRYIIRVTTTDSPANTPDMAKSVSRRSDPIVVDNTPPTFAADPEITIDKTTATVNFTVTDALLPIAAVHYAIDSTDQYLPTIPNDMIFDSTNESISIKIVDLSPGPHIITLRATDSQGNALYLAQAIIIP